MEYTCPTNVGDIRLILEGGPGVVFETAIDHISIVIVKDARTWSLTGDSPNIELKEILRHLVLRANNLLCQEAARGKRDE
jgi:hypothetical protein